MAAADLVTSSQGISSYGIDQVPMEFFSFNNKSDHTLVISSLFSSNQQKYIKDTVVFIILTYDLRL